MGVADCCAVRYRNSSCLQAGRTVVALSPLLVGVIMAGVFYIILIKRRLARDATSSKQSE